MTDNKRKYNRFEFKDKLKIIFDEKVIKARSINISLGGILLDLDEHIPANTKVDLVISLPTLPKESIIPCIVRWSSPKGAGLQFEKVRAIETWALTKLMNTLSPAP